MVQVKKEMKFVRENLLIMEVLPVKDVVTQVVMILFLSPGVKLRIGRSSGKILHWMVGK